MGNEKETLLILLLSLQGLTCDNRFVSFEQVLNEAEPAVQFNCDADGDGSVYELSARRPNPVEELKYPLPSWGYVIQVLCLKPDGGNKTLTGFVTTRNVGNVRHNGGPISRFEEKSYEGKDISDCPSTMVMFASDIITPSRIVRVRRFVQLCPRPKRLHVFTFNQEAQIFNYYENEYDLSRFNTVGQ